MPESGSTRMTRLREKIGAAQCRAEDNARKQKKRDAAKAARGGKRKTSTCRKCGEEGHTGRSHARILAERAELATARANWRALFTYPFYTPYFDPANADRACAAITLTVARAMNAVRPRGEFTDSDLTAMRNNPDWGPPAVIELPPSPSRVVSAPDSPAVSGADDIVPETPPLSRPNGRVRYATEATAGSATQRVVRVPLKASHHFTLHGDRLDTQYPTSARAGGVRLPLAAAPTTDAYRQVCQRKRMRRDLDDCHSDTFCVIVATFEKLPASKPAKKKQRRGKRTLLSGESRFASRRIFYRRSKVADIDSQDPRRLRHALAKPPALDMQATAPRDPTKLVVKPAKRPTPPPQAFIAAQPIKKLAPPPLTSNSVLMRL